MRFEKKNAEFPDLSGFSNKDFRLRCRLASFLHYVFAERGLLKNDQSNFETEFLM